MGEGGVGAILPLPQPSTNPNLISAQLQAQACVFQKPFSVLLGLWSHGPTRHLCPVSWTFVFHFHHKLLMDMWHRSNISSPATWLVLLNMYWVSLPINCSQSVFRTRLGKTNFN